MEVKVNTINTWYITMSEAVTMLSLMMMSSNVYEGSLGRDSHTDTHTYIDFGLVYLKLVQSRNKSPNKKCNCSCLQDCALHLYHFA